MKTQFKFALKKLSRKELLTTTGHGLLVGGGTNIGSGGTNNGGGSGNIICYHISPLEPCPEKESLPQTKIIL